MKIELTESQARALQQAAVLGKSAMRKVQRSKTLDDAMKILNEAIARAHEQPVDTSTRPDVQ